MIWIMVPLAMMVLFFLVDGDGAVEGAVHRVAAQQAGALDQVVVAALAHHDGAQPQLFAAAGVLDQDAGQQAADAAEAVEHDILRLAQQRGAPGVDGGQLAGGRSRPRRACPACAW